MVDRASPLSSRGPGGGWGSSWRDHYRSELVRRLLVVVGTSGFFLSKLVHLIELAPQLVA